MDLWAVNEHEKLALTKDLSGIPESSWDTPSLCTGWRVRDVVGHLVDGATVEKRDWWVGITRSGFNFDKFIARAAIAEGSAEPADLLQKLESSASSHNVPPFAKPVSMLGETICHAQDIRRPLGIDYQYAANRELEAVADWFKVRGAPFGTKKRIAGLRLTATDAAWSTGDGPEASGPLAVLILVMSGRPAALTDITGPATATLEQRFRDSR